MDSVQQLLKGYLVGSDDIAFRKYFPDGKSRAKKSGKAKTNGKYDDKYVNGLVEKQLPSLITFFEIKDSDQISPEGLIKSIAGKIDVKGELSWERKRVHNLLIEIDRIINNQKTIIHKQKIAIKKKNTVINQLQINDAQAIQALQQHNQEIALTHNSHHLGQVVPYEDDTFPQSNSDKVMVNTKINSVLNDVTTHVLKAVQMHVNLNTDAHKEKDTQISRLQDDKNQLQTQLTSAHTEILELNEELKLTQNLYQTKNSENLQLTNENILLKNKKPLDDFLTPQQILDTTPQSQPCDVGHLFCGRQKPDLDRGDPYYKIGLTIKTKPIIQVVHTLGLNAELLDVIRIKCIHSAETNLVNIFKIKFGNPIDNMDTFKADPHQIRCIIAAYIDHHQLKL